ncbi:hypothetical protein LINPERPRIM_LOCUS26681 [Linum perenne]
MGYCGGKVVSIADVEPAMINSFDLEDGFKSQVGVSGTYMYYFKKSLEDGVDSYQVILNDHHIRDLLKTCKGRDVYDIYVELLVEATSKDDDEKFDDSEESDSEDSDFEVGDWISDEEREDAELVSRKVQDVKEKMKKGIPFQNHFNGDGYESQGLVSDDNEYYVETDSDDETADHGVRKKSPYPVYNKNTETPFFETTMTFTSLDEARVAVIKYSIKERRDVRYMKNESYRIRLKCKFENCSWLFFVSLNKRFNLWQLKQYKEHVCPEHYRNKHVSPKFIAQHYKERIKSTPRWKNKHMRDTIREEYGVVVTLMQCSRAKKLGLVPSIANLFPSAEHRLCARHIYNNWRKKYRDPSLQKLFWNCAKASTGYFFNRHKEEIIRKNKEAAEAMVNIDPKYWSRAFFSTSVKCDSVDNNLSESFNALILEARHKPIFSMLEEIRVMCMDQIAVRRAIASKWKSSFCPKILSKLAANAKEARYCRIIGNGKEGYEVTYNHQDRFRVQLDEGKCSCRSWDLTGIPCPHSISCIISENKDPQYYISDCYKVEAYWSIYDNVMEPMAGHNSWTPSTYNPVHPPLSRKMPGRPKKNRVRSVEEKEDKARKRKRKYTNEDLLARDKKDSSKISKVGRVMTCTFCTKEGHNTRTCALRKAGGSSNDRGNSSTVDSN